MRNPTPFLPGISPQLCGRQRRSQRDQLRDQIERLRRQSLGRLCELFGPWLPQDLLKPAAKGSNSRERSFPVSLTFWAFLSQVLDSGSVCREIVRTRCRPGMPNARERSLRADPVPTVRRANACPGKRSKPLIANWPTN